MADYEIGLVTKSYDKHIEDVIDARKKIGQYNISSYTSNSVEQRNLTHNTFSVPMFENREEDETSITSSGYISNVNLSNLGPTDSEITLVRVKQRNLQNRLPENKWNLSDIAIPGDGTHLGHSPSLVNLVTFITCGKRGHYNEYCVPLSSWDPNDNPYELPDIQMMASCSTLNSSHFDFEENKLDTTQSKETKENLSLGKRLSQFLRRRRDKKSKVI